MSHLIRTSSELNIAVAEHQDTQPLRLDEATTKLIAEEVNRALDNFKQFELPQIVNAEKKSAFQQGYQAGKTDGILQGKLEGEKEGIDKGRKDTLEALSDEQKAQQIVQKNFCESLKRLDAEYEELVKAFEPIGIEIVFETLIKILGSNARSLSLVEDVFTTCSQKYGLNNLVKLHLSLNDYRQLVSDETVSHVFSMLKHVQILPDANVLPGGCILETRSGSIDARLESQLANFKEYLLEQYHLERTQKACLT